MVIGLVSGGTKARQESNVEHCAQRIVRRRPHLLQRGQGARTLAKHTWPHNCDSTTGIINILNPEPAAVRSCRQSGQWRRHLAGRHGHQHQDRVLTSRSPSRSTTRADGRGRTTHLDSNGHGYKDYIHIYAHPTSCPGARWNSSRSTGTDSSRRSRRQSRCRQGGGRRRVRGPGWSGAGAIFQNEFPKKILCVESCDIVAAAAGVHRGKRAVTLAHFVHAGADGHSMTTRDRQLATPRQEGRTAIRP